MDTNTTDNQILINTHNTRVHRGLAGSNNILFKQPWYKPSQSQHYNCVKQNAVNFGSVLYGHWVTV